MKVVPTYSLITARTSVETQQTCIKDLEIQVEKNSRINY